MSDQTPLDIARVTMDRSDADRLRYYATLADTELCLLLKDEPDGQDVSAQTVEVDGEELVLAFDTEARLASCATGVASYASLPGRILAQLLSKEGLGLALNLGVTQGETLLPPKALSWLNKTLSSDGPGTHDARIKSVEAAGDVPEILLEALGARLTASAGLAKEAILARAELQSGEKAHVLAITGAEARAEPALARAVSEALTFSGIEAGYLDVLFLPEGHAVVAHFARVGMRFEIPQPKEPEMAGVAPGMDPAKPPRLN